MSTVTQNDVRLFLTDYLRQKAHASGRTLSEELPDDYDLLLSGLIDSFGLIDLIGNLCTHFNHEISFEALDPEQLTLVGPLSKFVAQQVNGQ